MLCKVTEHSHQLLCLDEIKIIKILLWTARVKALPTLCTGLTNSFEC